MPIQPEPNLTHKNILIDLPFQLKEHPPDESGLRLSLFNFRVGFLLIFGGLARLYAYATLLNLKMVRAGGLPILHNLIQLW